jgi:secreted trypsin-like serine protease
MRLDRFALLWPISMLCWAVLAVPAAWAQDGCKDPRRIVGGEDADIKDHPWQVSLNIDGGLCGGSIIAQNWVLTAAHCFATSKQTSSVRVKAGVTNRKTGAWIAVDRVVPHDKYNAETNEHDLALVKLKLRPAGQGIPLAQTELQLRPCDLLEVTGWGRTTEGGQTSEVLQKATVPYVDNTTCNERNAYGGRIRPGMMCAGLREGGIDSCQGDSGGPLVLRGSDGPVLVGVVSWGEGCAHKLKYGVYTRVTPYRDWLKKVITSD